MNVTWVSSRYDPSKVVSIYGRRIGDEYKFYEVDAKSKTIREGWVKGGGLPADVKTMIDGIYMTSVHMVKMPDGFLPDKMEG